MRFQFRLALALGRTHAELLQTVSAPELIHWFAYSQLEPWGEQRAEVSRALCAANLAQLWTKDRVKVADLIPLWDRDPEPQGMSHEAWRTFVEAHNAGIAKGD